MSKYVVSREEDNVWRRNAEKIPADICCLPARERQRKRADRKENVNIRGRKDASIHLQFTVVQSRYAQNACNTYGSACCRTLVVDQIGNEREANDERARYVNEIYVCGQITLEFDVNKKARVCSFICIIVVLLLLLLLKLLVEM